MEALGLATTSGPITKNASNSEFSFACSNVWSVMLTNEISSPPCSVCAILPESSITPILHSSGPDSTNSRVGSAIMATMNSGIRMVEMMKLLRLTRSKYSRATIIFSAEFIVRAELRLVD